MGGAVMSDRSKMLSVQDRVADDRRLITQHDVVGLAVIVFVLVTVYSVHMLHGIGFGGDSIKWQFIVPTAGIGHETGNPVYLALAWLLTRIPVFDMGTRVNAISSLATLVAVVLLFFTLRRLSVRTSIAVVFSIWFGVSPIVLLYSVVAEVHTLHAAFISGALLMLILWQQEQQDRYLYLLIAIMAFSFGNSVTTALLVPGILVFLWKVDWRAAFRPRMIAAAAVGIAGATILYYYLIWRARDATAFYLELMPVSWGDVLDIVLGGRYRGVTMFDATPLQVAAELLPYLLFILSISVAVIAPLAFIGFRSLRRAPTRTMLAWWAVVTLLVIVTNGSRPGWVDPYLIPVVLVVVVFSAIGTEQVGERSDSWPFLGTAVLIVTLVVMVVPISPFGKFTDWREDYDYQHEVRSWLTDLPSESVIAVSYRDAMAVWYMVSIENVSTSVEVLHIDGFDLNSDWFTILDAYLNGHPGYAWQLRHTIAPGGDVFAPGDRWMCELVDAGFTLEPYSAHVYRVVASRNAVPAEQRSTPEMRAICSGLSA